MNRRDVLKSTVAAMFSGLAPNGPKAARPKRTPPAGPPDFDAYDVDGPAVTPELRRLRARSLALLLPAYGECEDALQAVLDAAPEPETEGDEWWVEDVEGVRVFVGRLRVMLEGESFDLEGAAAERERRRRAFERGAYRSCPVWWAHKALAGAQQALRDVLDMHDDHPVAWVAREAGQHLWLMDLLRSPFWGSFNLYLNDAARQEYRAEVLGAADDDPTSDA